jgi:hypothetical protein
MNALTEIAAPRRAEAIQVFDPIPALDSGKFEQMQRFASVLARSPLIPATLRGTWEGEGKSKTLIPYEPEQVFANCFLVVNQAVRWGMDPMSVIGCCSVVHGRLMYEGKLVAAVIDAKLGIKLRYHFNDRTGDNFGVRVIGPPIADSDEERVAEGTVGQWKTTGTNSPWTNPANHRRQLVYRGTREWTRLFEPAVLLGVYTPDELELLEEENRFSAPRQPTAPAIEARPTRRKREEKPDPIAERQREAEQPKDPPPQKEELVEGVNYRTEQDAEGNPVRVAILPADKKAAVDAAVVEAELERLERLVAEFEEAAPGAQTLDELEAIAADLEPLLADLPRKLATRAQNTWEDNRKRIALEPQATEAEPETVDEPAIDTNSPDYQTGYADAKRGLTRCIRPLKEDEARLALWRAGWQAAKDEDAGST